MPDIVSVTPASLEAEVYSSSGFVLLDLWAPWCAPCRALAPMLDKLAALGADHLTIAKLDVEQFPEMMSQFNVRGIPALLLFKDGQEVSRELGSKTLTQLKDWMTGCAVPLGEPTPRPVDVGTFGAFYGDAELKQFFCERLLEHATRGEVRLDSDPFWQQGTGTPAAAWVHSSDPQVFERLTGLQFSFAKALDFLGAKRESELQPIMAALKPGTDLNQVPLQLLRAFLGEISFDWPGLLIQSPLMNSLRSEWLTLCDCYLSGRSLEPRQYEDMVNRTRTLVDHPDRAVSITGELLLTMSPPPAAMQVDAWAQVFSLAATLVFSVGQHLAGWSLEDRQSEERRYLWFTEKQAQTPTGEFTDEELDFYQAQWMQENEAYQLKEDAFFSDGLHGLQPVFRCLQRHMAQLLADAPNFFPV